MTPPEDVQVMLADAHRQIARYRNALNAIQVEAKHVQDDAAPYSAAAMRAVRIERLVSTALGPVRPTASRPVQFFPRATQ